MLNCIQFNICIELYYIYVESGSILYYVNASKYQYIEGSGVNEVTLDRIRKFWQDPTRILPMKQCIQIYMSMHEIREKNYPESEELYYECDCRCYWYSAVICSHVLVVYHLLDIININHLVSRIAPKKKAGRPTKCIKALEKDKAVDTKGMKPAELVKTWRQWFGILNILLAMSQIIGWSQTVFLSGVLTFQMLMEGSRSMRWQKMTYNVRLRLTKITKKSQQWFRICCNTIISLKSYCCMELYSAIR